MFLVGLELDFKHILKVDMRILKSSLLYFFLIYLISILAIFLFNLKLIFITIFPLISIGILASLNKEYKNAEWIKIAIIVGSIGEVISILFLTVLDLYLHYGFETQFYFNLSYLFIFVFAVILSFKTVDILFWWYPEIKIFLMPKFDNKEQDLRFSFALIFILLAIVYSLKLELAFGSFIAGIFIINFFKHKENLEKKLSEFGFGFFVPIFFISVGISIDIELFLIDGILQKVILIAFLMFFARIISALIFVKIIGSKNSFLMALSHSMPLTLVIAVATLAHTTGHLEKIDYYASILASIFEVIIGLILIKLIIYLSKKIK
jgi:Kef-type K+ transport system membrane component KefB